MQKSNGVTIVGDPRYSLSYKVKDEDWKVRNIFILFFSMKAFCENLAVSILKAGCHRDGNMCFA